jgi:hypothetical protein
VSDALPFAVAGCARCGLTAWPRPALCRRCGCADFGDVAAPGGVVEETAAGLGTVRTDAGPVVVVRVSGVSPGDRVRLDVRDGALEATEDA